MSLTLSEIQKRTLAILEARIDQVALLPTVLSKLKVDSVDATEKIESLIRSEPSSGPTGYATCQCRWSCDP